MKQQADAGSLPEPVKKEGNRWVYGQGCVIIGTALFCGPDLPTDPGRRGRTAKAYSGFKVKVYAGFDIKNKGRF